MTRINTRYLAGACALSLGFALSACGGMASNPTLYSTHQPVVERTNYTFDMQAGPGGASVAEQRRLAGWFEAMDLRYGDRLAIEDPMYSGATREAVSAIAERHGILLSDGAPVTSGYVQPGFVRVVITRSKATVPGCSDWSDKSDMNYKNGTSNNYGCATNSNLAAMVANPEDLVSGQTGTGQTVVSTASKAIDSYRKQTPTGEGGVSKSGSTGTGGN